MSLTIKMKNVEVSNGINRKLLAMNDAIWCSNIFNHLQGKTNPTNTVSLLKRSYSCCYISYSSAEKHSRDPCHVLRKKKNQIKTNILGTMKLLYKGVPEIFVPAAISLET